MSGSLDDVRGHFLLEELKRQSQQRMPIGRRAPVAPLDAVLSALLITIGLCAGLVALMPPRLLEQLPVVHLAVAFFIPLTAILAMTELNLPAVGKAITHGLIAILIFSLTAFIVTMCVHASAATPPACSITAAQPGQCARPQD